MEYLDLYDRERKLTGETVIRGEPIPAGRYHIVIHVCIFNSRNEMLIQKRSSNKTLWAGLWDVTVGGAVQTGSNSWQTAQEELEEELGISLDFSQIRPSLTVHFPVGFDDFYLIGLDIQLEDLRFQIDEVDEAIWADENRILSMLYDGSFLPYHPSLISTLFAMRQRMGNFSG